MKAKTKRNLLLVGIAILMIIAGLVVIVDKTKPFCVYPLPGAE